MSEPWSVDRLHRLTRRLTRHLSTQDSSPALHLAHQLVYLDRCLVQIRRAITPPPSLLWIDDVAAALDSALKYLTTPPEPPKRPASVSTFFSRSKGSGNKSSSTRSALSTRLRTSVVNFLSPSTQPSVASSPLSSAARVVSEWVAAMYAALDDARHHDQEDSLSMSDALPPLPHQYAACRDPLYHRARAALRDAANRATKGAGNTPAVALLGAHGVGKTMLAMELVQDVDLCHNFADSVAWLQLGAEVTDEEVADQLIRCVETIVAGDFRRTVRFCSSLQAVAAKAGRMLTEVCSLVVIDDVSGPRAQRSFDLVVSALSTSSVVLYTAPIDVDDKTGETLDVSNVTCIEKLWVQPLERNGFEAFSIFRAWLRLGRVGEGREAGGLMRYQKNEQGKIVAACHGLPLALAMAAGFLSKFQTSWQALANTLATSQSADESITRILKLLTVRGGSKFEAQLKVASCLPKGVWVSLSALADLWGMDSRTMKGSARRLGRLAFAEYRLGDSGDESRVRFHWHILRYCRKLAGDAELLASHRKLLTNVGRRKTPGKPRLKTDYVPWWTPFVGDRYICRRLHWHMSRAGAVKRLQELICDFQWVFQRLESDGLLGVASEFKLAMNAEEKDGRVSEATGFQRVLSVIQELSESQSEDDAIVEMGALPTFLVSRLHEFESSSACCKKFLTSVYQKARRPWLKPAPAVENKTLSAPADVLSSSAAYEYDAFAYQANCLAASVSGKVICGDKSGNLQVYDPATGRNIASWNSSHVGGYPNGRGIGALGTINDCVLSGHLNGRLFLRSIRSGESELLDTTADPLDGITCIASTENGVVAVGSNSGSVFVLKHVKGFGSAIRRVDLEGHCDVVTSLLVFSDGRRIASSSVDGFAAIWILRSTGPERISLNGHKPETGHKENYITAFAALSGGKRLLSACRGGVVSAWNVTTGECIWTRRFGFKFSRPLALQSFGTELFAPVIYGNAKPKTVLRVGSPYLVTRGEGPRDLLIVAAGRGGDVLASIRTEQTISTWLEVWHPSTQRIFVAVSHVDGTLASYELVTSLK